MAVSKKGTEERAGGGVTRRDALVKAGVVGAGAIAAGSLAGGAKASTRRAGAPSKIRRGGRIIWALEQDPVHVAPFGAILTSNHWGKQAAYDSLVEWDKNLNLKPALATSWKIAADQKSITFNLRKGVKFHNGKELDAGDVKYSIEKMLAPPLPGSIVTVSQVPGFEGADVVSKYVVRLRLKTRDARVFGFLAWNRYSPIVPAGLYDQINAARNAIGTGPYRMVGFNPNDRVEYVANKSFWKPGQPYMDAMTLKTLPDEQSRIAALRAGAIDGATVSSDGAKSLANDSSLVVLKGGTAAFRELQFTIKGDPKPWHDARVRRAVNFAINRQAIINTVYNGNGNYSGIVPPGYGSWPFTQAELKSKYQKFDLPKAKALMAAAGQTKGFSVKLSTFSTPLEFQQIASVIKSQLKAINIDVEIVAQEPGTFDANNGTGNFEWDLTARGMRGDIDGYLSEYNPSNTIYQRWYPLYKNVKVWRAIGNGKITLDPAKRLPIYKGAQVQLMNDLPQIGLIQVNKYQVVNKRVQGMYVAFDDFNTGLRNNVWLAS
ncbi:MAG: ABC transporter substrate-binding protein [Thermoleophilia bacterium]|nr:ABC transporter substrate-binding protein [Thermoleophilia bacterium]